MRFGRSTSAHFLLKQKTWISEKGTRVTPFSLNQGPLCTCMCKIAHARPAEAGVSDNVEHLLCGCLSAVEVQLAAVVSCSLFQTMKCSKFESTISSIMKPKQRGTRWHKNKGYSCPRKMWALSSTPKKMDPPMLIHITRGPMPCEEGSGETGDRTGR